MPSPPFYIVSIAMIVSFFFYKKFANTIYISFAYYLIFAFIIELAAFLVRHYFNLNNNFVYNISSIITYFFYIFFYKSLFRKKMNKKMMELFLILYSLFFLFDIFVLNTHFTTDLFSNSMVLGAFLIFITLILFLIEIINNEIIILNIKKTFIFWISVGALLFHIGVVPILISSELLELNGLFDSILMALYIIMYGSFILGFFLADKKYHY